MASDIPQAKTIALPQECVTGQLNNVRDYFKLYFETSAARAIPRQRTLPDRREHLMAEH